MRLALEKDEGLFLGLLAVFATLAGYRFGFGNQLEQLPLVLHALDPSLLANDFYVASSADFSPRFYYVWLLATLAAVLPLPAVVAGLALASNAALAFVSHGAARDLLGADRTGGFLAASLALCVGGFPLGLVTDVRFHDFQPGSLAIPLGLAALWAGLRARPIVAGALAAVACLPHPLYGLETGALALGACAVTVWLRGGPVAERLGALLPTLLGGALMGGAAFLAWALPWSGANPQPLPENEFIGILTFRSPHHYLPSVFPAAHWVLAGAFAGAFALAWGDWTRAERRDAGAFSFLFPPLAVGLLCVGGWAFVEPWPSRLWVTAQPYRLLYLVKWQGFLLLGWWFGRWIAAGRLPQVLLAWIAFFSTGAAQPLVTFGCGLADRLDTALRRRIPELPPLLFAAVALLAALPFQVLLAHGREVLCVAVAAVCVLALREPGSRWGRGVAVAVVAAASLFTFTTDSLRPVARFADHRGPDAELARFAKQALPRDAVVHVPPGLGSFRLLAERAVVVDFKALPFAEHALREWKSRIADAYGVEDGGGFPALERMDENHRQVDDAQLAEIAARYGASYAVLYAETRTERPVLYENDVYKLIEL